MATLWPISLQQKLNTSGFEKVYGDTRVSSSVDVGPSKVRSRYTRSVDGYRCVIWIEHSLVSVFETFYKTSLAHGTLPFTFTDPFTEVATDYRFQVDSTPSIRPVGGLIYELQMVWEILP